MVRSFTVLTIFLVISLQATSQTNSTKVITFMAVVHPLITFNKNETVINFKDFYTVGFPAAINVWRNTKIGFSLEVIPYIKAQGGSSKMSNVVFHPGALIPLGKDWVFAGRLAFETSGRYGVTPVFNKIVKKNKYNNLFIALPFPIRFGNDLPPSFTVGFEIGISF